MKTKARSRLVLKGLALAGFATVGLSLAFEVPSLAQSPSRVPLQSRTLLRTGFPGPPPEIREAILREAFDVIDRVSTSGADPVSLVRAVNHLRALDEIRAIDV